MEIDLKLMEIKNFKSCKDIKIEFGNFNVLIGANGSGKSNIIEAFRFLREIISQGVINPFIKYGGYKNLVWRNDEALPISFSVVFGAEDVLRLEYSITISGYAGSFEVIQEEIKGKIKDEEIGILRKGRDEIIFKVRDVEIGMKVKTSSAPILSSQFFDIFGFVESVSGITSFSSANKKYEKYINCVGKKPDEEIKIFIREIFMRLPVSLSTQPELLINPLSILFFLCRECINSIFVFNLIPQMMKLPSKFEEKELSYNGENLQTFLFNIFSEHRGWPEEITERLKILFPNMSNMSVISTPDGRIMLKVIENEITLQMNSLSDGFFKILAILALCFEYKYNPKYFAPNTSIDALEKFQKHAKKIIIIEEIENNIHPEAIEILIDALEASGNTIILTTHSPVVLNMTDIKDILLVKKDVDETIVEKVKDTEKLKEELIKNGISVGQGWLLGALE
ncbi:MAG: hypothetical protein CVT89_03695 [Candidatus Altiarchaeales archaeon HGW-Altiarchaeales-2]|nr:MAG: hypothetical protein CVT89_03695 [Candidatus Altiarchaeales archaeon HGW-Altiarchaeales-2]